MIRLEKILRNFGLKWAATPQNVVYEKWLREGTALIDFYKKRGHNEDEQLKMASEFVLRKMFSLWEKSLVFIGVEEYLGWIREEKIPRVVIGNIYIGLVKEGNEERFVSSYKTGFSFEDLNRHYAHKTEEIVRWAEGYFTEEQKMWALFNKEKKDRLVESLCWNEVEKQTNEIDKSEKMVDLKEELLKEISKIIRWKVGEEKRG